MVILNLFALRATDPRAMLTHDDPIGPGNDVAINALLHAPGGHVICAWGEHGRHLDRSESIKQAIKYYNVPARVLKLNKSGEPSHPLYLPRCLEPKPWDIELRK